MGGFYRTGGYDDSFWRLMQFVFEAELPGVLRNAAAGVWAGTPWPAEFVEMFAETIAFVAAGKKADAAYRNPVSLVHGDYQGLPIYTFMQYG